MLPKLSRSCPHWTSNQDIDKDRPKTAFTTFNRMPFGLQNVPATFQRVIDTCGLGLPKILILAHLAGIIVCSESFESHLSDFNDIFERLLLMVQKVHTEFFPNSKSSFQFGKEKAVWEWVQEVDTALNSLKELLSSPPGGVLYQGKKDD